MSSSAAADSLEGTPAPLPLPGQGPSTSQLPPLPNLNEAGSFGEDGAGAGMRFVPGDPDDSEGEDDDDDDSGRPKKKAKKTAGRAAGAGAAAAGGGDEEREKGRRKIEIEYIQKKEKRHITFSKRKAGIMKKVSLCCTASFLRCPASAGVVVEEKGSPRLSIIF